MTNQDINLHEFHENTDKWDNRELGADENHASLASEADDDELQRLLNGSVDESIECKMQLISIRLPKDLIGDLKSIGKDEGLGYQTLAREILKRFVESENRRKYNEALVRNEKLVEELELMKKRNRELHEDQDVKCG